MSNRQKIQIKLNDSSAVLPTRSYDDAVGYDLYAIEDCVIKPLETQKIDTGISLTPPEGWYAEIKERSGLGSKGLAVRGGQIDPDFRGSIKVMLTYLKKPSLEGGEYLNSGFQVAKGDKIAQIVFKQYGKFDIEVVDELEETERGASGFGSTG